MCMVHATDLIYFIQVPGFKETIVKEGGGKCTTRSKGKDMDH